MTERQLLVQKCGKILHHALIDIRNLALRSGNEAQIGALADLVHNVPQFMTGRDMFGTDGLRAGFIAYARKYHPNIDPVTNRYVVLLDMDEASFSNEYRGHHPWPEPAETAG